MYEVIIEELRFKMIIDLLQFRPYCYNLFKILSQPKVGPMTCPSNTMIFMLGLVIIKLCASNYVQITNGAQTLPPHVYRLTCNSGCNISAVLTWSHNADLQLYLYNAYQNVLSDNSYLRIANSGSKSNQILSFRPSTNFGYFYIRVELYSMSTNPTDYLFYNLALTGTNSATYSNYMFKSQPTMAIALFPKADGCRVRVNYTLGSAINSYAIIYTPSRQFSTFSATSLYNQMIKSSTQNGNWVIALAYNYTSAVNTTLPFSYSVQYETVMNTQTCCQEDRVWNANTYSCEQQNTQDTSTSSTSFALIGVIIGCLALILGVAIAIAVCCYRRWRYRQDLHHGRRVNALAPYEEGSVQQINFSEDLNISGTVTCSICLENNCNVTLICKHNFHKNCIVAWKKKNQLCPLCRMEIRNNQSFNLKPGG